MPKRVFTEEQKEKKKIYDRKYRLENLEKKKIIEKEWRISDRGKEKKRKNEQRYRYGKNGRERTWKIMGIILNEDTYEKYELATNCESCNIEFEGKGNNKKCLDHHHPSGHVRNIICNKCNVFRGVVDNNIRKLLLDLHQYFNRS